MQLLIMFYIVSHAWLLAGMSRNRRFLWRTFTVTAVLTTWGNFQQHIWVSMTTSFAMKAMWRAWIFTMTPGIQPSSTQSSWLAWPRCACKGDNQVSPNSRSSPCITTSLRNCKWKKMKLRGRADQSAPCHHLGRMRYFARSYFAHRPILHCLQISNAWLVWFSSLFFVVVLSVSFDKCNISFTPISESLTLFMLFGFCVPWERDGSKWVHFMVCRKLSFYTYQISRIYRCLYTTSEGSAPFPFPLPIPIVWDSTRLISTFFKYMRLMYSVEARWVERDFFFFSALFSAGCVWYATWTELKQCCFIDRAYAWYVALLSLYIWVFH